MSPPAYVPPPPPRQVRRAYRDTESGVLGGVAAGLAEHLRVPVFGVRAFFVIATVFGAFVGVLLYAGLWLFMPAATPVERSTPGGEAASRGGRRPGRTTRWRDTGPVVALLVFGVGAALLLQAIVGRGPIFLALLLAGVGVALLWRQADQAQRDRWLDSRPAIAPARLLFGQGGWETYLRLISGLVLIIAAGLLVWLDNGSMLADGWGVLVAVALLILGVVLVVGPWVLRLATDLSAEREERIRTQERADVAAHLHDSVLQTLALVQKQSHDSRAVEAIARRQERELRRWLYGDEADDTTLKAALTSAAAEVEDEHSVPVEIVVVGDHELTTGLRALVQAAREAMVNAAKHSGADVIDTYGEVDGDTVEVFVRDRGRGFDLDTIAEDRQGVRGSIINRMQRHGGQARIRTSPDDGTEVRLEMET